MALRAREIYYFVRVGNYATRPLRALQADFHGLAAAGDAAANRLERLNLEQKRLASSIALRRANIGAMGEENVLRAQERQLALQRQNMALANRRTAINNRIVASEERIDQAIARGNTLEKQRALLEEKSAAASVRARRALSVQQSRLLSQANRLARQQTLIPSQRTAARLGMGAAQARLVVAREPLTLRQQAGARAGRISDDPSVAKLQARYLAAEKAIVQADLALKRLDITERGITDQQVVLAKETQRLAASEKEIQLATQQAALSLERLDGQIVDNQVAIDRYRREVQGFTTSLEALVVEERRLSVAEQRLIEQRLAAAASIAKEEEALAGEVAALERVTIALKQQQAVLRQQRWDRIALGARALSDFGRTAQYAGGLTLLAFGLMGREAARFATSVTLAATQVGKQFGNVSDRVRETAATSKLLQTGILAQMRKFPAAADDMSKATYEIASSLTLQGDATQQSAQALKILSVFNRAAVAGQTKLADVTNAGITILNQFGDANLSSGRQVQQLNKFMDQAFAAVRFGRETFAEFTTTLANAAPAAKAANQSFANMAGTLAFLTRRLPVRQASVAYARLLEILQRAEKGLGQHGVKVRNVAGMYRPLDKIIGDIVAKNPDLVAGRKNIIEFFKQMTKGSGSGTMGTIQARRAFVFLVQQYKQYQQVLKSTTRDQGEFWKSFRALQATPEVKWKIFVNQLHALAIEIGQYAIPALLRMLSPIAKLVQWFEHLDKQTKRNIGTIGVWASGLLLVGGTAAVIIGSVGRIIATLATFSAKLVGTKAELAGLGSEAGAVTAVLARRLAIGAIILLMIKFHHETAIVIKTLGGLKNVLELIAVILTARMVRAYASVAIAAIASAATQIAANRSVAVSAGEATAKVGLLRTALLGIAGGVYTATIVVTVEMILHREAVRKFMDKVSEKLHAAVHRVPGLHFLIPDAASFQEGTDVDRRRRKQIADERAQARRIAEARKLLTDPSAIDRGVTRARRVQVQQAYWRREQVKIVQANKAATVAQKLNNRSIAEWIRLAIRANKYAAAHPKNLQAQIRAATIMNQIQSHFTGAQLQGIQAVISADTAGTKKRIKNVQQLAKATIDNMKQVYDELLQKNQEAFGSITDGVRAANALEWNAIPKASDLLKDLQDQVRKFERWRRELAQLQRRGLPAGLIAQIQEAGPEKEGFLKAILRMTPKQIAQYVALWKRGQRDIHTATAVDFNNQLAQWRKHGRNAAIQFMKGMRDEGSFINTEMRRIFLSWLKGNMRAQLPTGGHRPPRHTPPPRGRHHPRPDQTTVRGRTGHGHRTTGLAIQRHISIKEGDIHIKAEGQDITTAHRKARLIQKNRRANRLNWGTT